MSERRSQERRPTRSSPRVRRCSTYARAPSGRMASAATRDGPTYRREKRARQRESREQRAAAGACRRQLRRPSAWPHGRKSASWTRATRCAGSPTTPNSGAVARSPRHERAHPTVRPTAPGLPVGSAPGRHGSDGSRELSQCVDARPLRGPAGPLVFAARRHGPRSVAFSTGATRWYASERTTTNTVAATPSAEIHGGGAASASLSMTVATAKPELRKSTSYLAL